MKCIECEGATEVLATYQNADGVTKRRRKCSICNARFTTRERAEGREREKVEESDEIDRVPPPVV
jgi:transcriptional regulator NrdR family protein